MKRKDSGSMKNGGMIAAVEEPYDMHLEPISSDEDEFTYEPRKLDDEKALCLKTLEETTKSDKQETRKNWTLKGTRGGNKRQKMADKKQKPADLEPVSSDEDEGTFEEELTKDGKSTDVNASTDYEDDGDDEDDTCTSSEEDTQVEKNKEKRSESRKWFREREQEQLLQKSSVVDGITEPGDNKNVPKIDVVIESL